MRRRKSEPWFKDVRERMRLLRELRREFPDVDARATGRGMDFDIVIRLTVPVPDHDARRVTIRVCNGPRPYYPRVTADGPSDSPHRYRDNTLCMWHPDDPDEERWVPADGLLALTRHVQVHLFKEAWYRQSGEWIGEEASHRTPKPRTQAR